LSETQRRMTDRLVRVMAMAGGVLLPIAASLWWVYSAGGLPALTEIATEYWPLYAEITGARPHTLVAGADLWIYRLDRFIFSRDLRHLIWVPAIVGSWVAWTQLPGQRRAIALLIGVAFALEIYPLAAGKYWGYHWLPSFYGASLLAALCFVPIVDRSRVPRDLTAAMTIVMLTAHAPSAQTYWRHTRSAIADDRTTVATEVACSRLIGPPASCMRCF
jgi:hypothetical protein